MVRDAAWAGLGVKASIRRTAPTTARRDFRIALLGDRNVTGAGLRRKSRSTTPSDVRVDPPGVVEGRHVLPGVARVRDVLGVPPVAVDRGPGRLPVEDAEPTG